MGDTRGEFRVHRPDTHPRRWLDRNRKPLSSRRVLTFQNLKKTVEAAGGTMANVTQVIVYLTTKDAFADMNKAFAAAFEKPFPNRATLIVAGLMVPGACIEITATCHLKK